MIINKTMKELGFNKNFKLTDKESGQYISLEKEFIIHSIEFTELKQILVIYETPWTAKLFSIRFGVNTNKVVYNKFKKLLEEEENELK